MLTWDVIVLNGYLLLNLHICGYLLYMRFAQAQTPDPRWYVPFVFLSIFWAISIHSVTAFLYGGLGGRPFWNSALLAPRFIATAFITGPAFVIVLLQLVRRFSSFHVGDGPIRTLTSVMRVTVLLNLFMLGSELFTALYTGGAHASSVRYLFLGLHGHHGLVPWIWSAVALNITSALLLHLPASRRRLWLLDLACACAFSGVWIEKGMGLIIPGFVPSTLHEIVDPAPPPPPQTPPPPARPPRAPPAPARPRWSPRRSSPPPPLLRRRGLCGVAGVRWRAWTGPAGRAGHGHALDPRAPAAPAPPPPPPPSPSPPPPPPPPPPLPPPPPPLSSPPLPPSPLPLLFLPLLPPSLPPPSPSSSVPSAALLFPPSPLSPLPLLFLPLLLPPSLPLPPPGGSSLPLVRS